MLADCVVVGDEQPVVAIDQKGVALVPRGDDEGREGRGAGASMTGSFDPGLQDERKSRNAPSKTRNRDFQWCMYRGLRRDTARVVFCKCGTTAQKCK